MSDLSVSELGRVTARGTPRQIGRALGEAGHDAVHEVLLRADYWRAVTSPAHADAVQAMAENLQTLFPAIWEELQGLAEGLHLPLEQVVAWNCRGDLLSNVPDGCTTVQIPGATPIIGHNEDGLPGFRGHAFLAEITPDDGPALMSFCYPGSIPGHTFATNAAGLVQAVNNLRLQNTTAQLPRMGIGRAIVACETLDQALELCDRYNKCGGFHMTLAQSGDRRLLSVEFGNGQTSVKEIHSPAVHANHALHMDGGADRQTITASSHNRQARGTNLLSHGEIDPLRILRDSGGPGLPIHRTQADDPDHENTLATAVFHVGPSTADWRVYDQTSDNPVFASA